jgi:serine/threonine protein kinase
VEVVNTMRKCSTCGTLYASDLCPKCMAGFAQNPTGPTAPPEELPLKPGQSFHGMEIQELLGKGGMGVVYKARQPALDRLVALKILPQKFANDPDFQSRFIREAKALGSLNHPNIVAVYDFGAEGGLFFFAMEFVDGTNLRQILRDKKLTAGQALKLVPQLCDALEYAHEEGVVHRDIKPENILLDRKGRVKIADFGLAKLVGADVAQQGMLTMTNMVMGTPHYMAPEQVENPKGVDHRADIYSIGVVFYEMLTGELPIGRFELPSKKVQIDVRLDEVVLKALEKAPERRYQKASDVKEAVTRVTAVGSTDAYSPTIITPAPATKRSSGPGMLVMASVTAVAVLVALVATLRKPAPVPPLAPPPAPVSEAPKPPEPVNLARLYFGPDERPLGYKYLTGDKEKPKPLPRNPYPAKEPAELEHVAEYLGEFGVQNVSPSDLKQGYVAVWWGASFFALESPIADRLETEVNALKAPANRWAYRNGPLLALVFAGPAEARPMFVDLVTRAQKKLGLPADGPDLPVERILYTDESLPSEYEFGPAHVHGVGTGETRSETQMIAPKSDPGKVTMSIRSTAFRDPEGARREEAALLGRKVARRLEVLRSGKTVTVLEQMSDDIHGYEQLAGPVRERMGFPAHSFETATPVAAELPPGFAFETTRADAAAIVSDLGLEVKATDIKRAWQGKLKPSGQITLFEVSDYSARSRVEEQVKKRGAAENGHDLVFAVEGPDDETLDALENRMREKFGWDRRQPRPVLIARLPLQPSELPPGWILENPVTGPRLYSADLKGPTGVLKLTAKESHNYGEIEKFRKDFDCKPGDILLFNYAVIAHVGGGSAATWSVLDQVETVLRKKMRMVVPRLEDFPLSTGTGDSATVIWDKVLREKVDLKAVADRLGIEVSKIRGALVRTSVPGRVVLELADGADLAPKSESLLRRGRFLACLESKDPLADVVKAQLRTTR